MPLDLLPIPPDGRPAGLSLPEVALSACDATAAMYRRTGFVPPWIGYIGCQDGRPVGTCAFKTAPQNGRVEIAYFTFPGHEGRGVATEMARRLIRLACQTDPAVAVTAQTLPEENASTAILRKLGFAQTGWADDDEAGRVWEWHWQGFA